MPTQITTKDDLIALFPRTPEQIHARVETANAQLKSAIDALIAIPNEQRSWANTAQALDSAIANSQFSVLIQALSLSEMVSPDEHIRKTAHDQFVKMQEFMIDVVGNNVDLYHALKAYADGNAKHEQLRDDQRYFLSETLDEYRRRGLDLPADKQEEVKRLNKELAQLNTTFAANIAADMKTIAVDRNELLGLDEQFIASLKQDDSGKYILGTDYPTYSNVMENCEVAATRKKMFVAYNNRAYPVNDALLKEIIAKRDELAKLLGFKSYAHLDTDGMMVKSPERVEPFLQNILKKVALKEQKEFEQLTKKLPASVVLTSEGKFNPWDISYVIAQYKKTHFALDEGAIAQYFPMEHTVKALLNIYEQFLSLRFEQVPLKGLWHEDVQLVVAYSKEDNRLLGYLLLDLYPRPFKFTHACQATVIPAMRSLDGSQNVAALMVIANFPKSTATQPSLLKRNDVNTFFHEFGHAMHALLGRTLLASQSGTNVKLDFVEMPSQMLEEWLWNRDILKMVSKHYQTGEQLPDELIDAILKLKYFDSGTATQRQAYLATLSLDYYLPGALKDPYVVLSSLYGELRPHVQFAPEDRFYASFGHLTDYGARYYSYLWSKVFALDMFDYIKQQGLLNSVVGNEYITKVIGKGGSVDPDTLLRDFLGREPNDKAFFADLGL